MINVKDELKPKYDKLKEKYPNLLDMEDDDILKELSNEEYAIYISSKLDKWITNSRLNKVCYYWKYACVFLSKKEVVFDELPECCRHVLFGARYYMRAVNDVKVVYGL